MLIPKVFVSYSHDSQDHKKWVLDFAIRLRNNGIDAIIDQWELKPGDDLPHFMETHLAASDYVLMICSDRYVEKANSGIGGVGYEKMIITAELMRRIDSNKIIPIIRQPGTRNVPTFLKTKLFIDFSIDDDFEFSFDELIRTLHKSPLFKKPVIGNNPFAHVDATQPEKVGESIKQLMSVMVNLYESGDDFAKLDEIVKAMNGSRIMTEFLLRKVIEKGLVKQDNDGDYRLTDKGKFYSVENKLVST